MPLQLGVSLVLTYQRVGIPLYKPYLRAQMEHDMKAIVAGQKERHAVLNHCVSNMVHIYEATSEIQDRIL